MKNHRDRRARCGQLRLIATTDLHGAVLPYDYVQDCAAPGSGLDALRGTIDAARAEVTAAVVLDNGDFMQGTPMMDVIAPALQDVDKHPMISAMNMIGYDAVALGNHEFNFGLDVLARAIGDLDCPCLCANILDAATGLPWAAPWTIIERQIQLRDGTTAPLRIGIIGFAPQQIPIWDRLTCADQITADPILATAARAVPEVRAAGADIVVALCHSGIGSHVDMPEIENAAVPLAAIDGIDAIILGHTHLTFPNNAPPDGPVDPQRGTLHGKPAIMPQALAGSVGCIDLTLHLDATGWRVIGFEIAHLPPSLTDGQLITAPDVARAHDATCAHIRKPVGHCDAQLHSYFSRVANCTTLRIVSDAQIRLARATLAGTPEADLPLLSAVAPFKSGGRMGAAHFIDIPAGPLAMRHIAQLYLYPNLICIAAFSGAEIATWLERSAGMFLQITAGGGAQPMIDCEFPSYNFDILDGLTYRFDLTQAARCDASGTVIHPASNRLSDLRYQGRPIDPDARFMVVSNSYRIGGGGAFFANDPARAVINTKTQARDAIADYLAATSPVAQKPHATWGFTAIAGASGLFQTAPAAIHLPESDIPKGIIAFHPAPDGYVMGEIAFG